MVLLPDPGRRNRAREGQISEVRLAVSLGFEFSEDTERLPWCKDIPKSLSPYPEVTLERTSLPYTSVASSVLRGRDLRQQPCLPAGGEASFLHTDENCL